MRNSLFLIIVLTSTLEGIQFTYPFIYVIRTKLLSIVCMPEVQVPFHDYLELQPFIEVFQCQPGTVLYAQGEQLSVWCVYCATSLKRIHACSIRNVALVLKLGRTGAVGWPDDTQVNSP